MTEKNRTAGLKVPTNGWVGNLLGYSDSGASLLRRGKRQPRLALMRTVAGTTGWHTMEQIQALEEGTWAEEFERRLARVYTAEVDARAAAEEPPSAAYRARVARLRAAEKESQG